MNDLSTEADARILIDDLLDQAGWDPGDKSMVSTEVPVGSSGRYATGREGHRPSGVSSTADGGRPETPGQNDIPDLLGQWKAFKESGFREPPGVETGTMLDPGSEAPRCWWATVGTLTEQRIVRKLDRY